MQNLKDNPIPKVIHYCWFGNNPLPESVEKCINSWKVYLPDYKIIEWNENNFDIKMNSFVQQAYESKKFAFVTDYVRLFALYKYGGVYMDTDVEIIKNIDMFLINSAFSGFESEKQIPTAIMGAKKGNKWIKVLLDYYDNRDFILKDGSLDTTTNVTIITDITRNTFDIKLNNQYQVLENLTLYPKDYFCPKSYKTGKITITDNTYAIHHFSGSWLNTESIKKRKNNHQLINVFGENIGMTLVNIRDVYKANGLLNLLRIINTKVRK